MSQSPGLVYVEHSYTTHTALIVYLSSTLCPQVGIKIGQRPIGTQYLKCWLS